MRVSRQQVVVGLGRIAVLAGFLFAWQYLPDWNAARRHVRWLDPFFISSPTLVYHKLGQMINGDTRAGVPVVWPYLENTVKATLIGTAIGIAIGCFLGALLSNNETLCGIFSVYVAAVNTIPRIALIPIVVLIVGATLTASIVTCVLVVTFVAFFNAFAGGRSVPSHMLQNARLLGASPRQIMLQVRFPHVLQWTFAALPNAISFGLLTVVAAELITGTKGMGGLILAATTNIDASLSFAVVVILSAVGTALVLAAEWVKRIVLHWA